MSMGQCLTIQVVVAVIFVALAVIMLTYPFSPGSVVTVAVSCFVSGFASAIAMVSALER